MIRTEPLLIETHALMTLLFTSARLLARAQA
jgi:hypothetical protein